MKTLDPTRPGEEAPWPPVGPPPSPQVSQSLPYWLSWGTMAQRLAPGGCSEGSGAPRRGRTGSQSPRVAKEGQCLPVCPSRPLHVVVSPVPAWSGSHYWRLLSPGNCSIPTTGGHSTHRAPQSTPAHCHPFRAHPGGRVTLVPWPGFCFREPRILARALPPPAQTSLATLTCLGPGTHGMPGSGGG